MTVQANYDLYIPVLLNSHVVPTLWEPRKALSSAMNTTGPCLPGAYDLLRHEQAASQQHMVQMQLLGPPILPISVCCRPSSPQAGELLPLI